MGSKKINREGVEEIIRSDKVVIFSKTTCPYCNKVKQLFKSINQTFTTIEVNKEENTDEYQNILEEITGARTVPRVFINGEFVGGCSDVQELHRKGELVTKL